MKTISLILVIVLLAGCATTYQPRPDVTAEQMKADEKSCKQTGMKTTGWVLFGVGIALVPIGLLLAIPGVAVLGEAVKKEKECMLLRGYQPVEQVATAQ